MDGTTQAACMYLLDEISPRSGHPPKVPGDRFHQSQSTSADMDVAHEKNYDSTSYDYGRIVDVSLRYYFGST